MPLIGKGDFYWNTIHVDDAASAMVYCYFNFDRLKNRTINFTDFNPITFSKILEDISFHFGLKKPSKIPRWIARLVLKKDLYRFVTASYKVKKEEGIADWNPEHPNFIQGIISIAEPEKSNRV